MTTQRNVARGTVLYNPPAVYLDRAVRRPLEDFKKGDIWSFGMILYCLLNPSERGPWLLNLAQSEESGADVPGLISKGHMPAINVGDQAISGAESLNTAYKRCVVYAMNERPTAAELCQLLSRYVLS